MKRTAVRATAKKFLSITHISGNIHGTGIDCKVVGEGAYYPVYRICNAVLFCFFSHQQEVPDTARTTTVYLGIAVPGYSVSVQQYSPLSGRGSAEQVLYNSSRSSSDST